MPCRRIAALGLVLLVVGAGCSICHAPKPTPAVPVGVESAAFLDTTTECWTIDVRPSFAIFMRVLMDSLRMSLQMAGATR